MTTETQSLESRLAGVRLSCPNIQLPPLRLVNADTNALNHKYCATCGGKQRIYKFHWLWKECEGEANHNDSSSYICSKSESCECQGTGYTLSVTLGGLLRVMPNGWAIAKGYSGAWKVVEEEKPGYEKLHGKGDTPYQALLSALVEAEKV